MSFRIGCLELVTFVVQKVYILSSVKGESLLA